MKPILFVVALLTTFQVVWGESKSNEGRELGAAFIGISAEVGIPSPLHIHNKKKLHQGIKLSALTLDGFDYTYQHGLNMALVSLIQENIGVGCALAHWVEHDSIGVQLGLISAGARRGSGVQVGLVTGWVLSSFHCNYSWTEYMNGLQLGVFNLAQKSRAQLGIYNHVTDTGGVQLGFWNRCTLEEFPAPTGEVQIQFGIFNTISLPEHRRLRVANSSKKCKFWSIGFLNETSSGWFIPFSNFGL